VNTQRSSPGTRAGLAALLLIVASPFAAAQSFATKPVRVITPFAPGGSTDILARALGEGLNKELGQPIIVESKTGAGSVLGNDAVAKSPADGHTLLLTTSAIAIVPSLNPKLPYGADTAFAPITILGRAPNVFFVRKDSPLKSAADFLAQARARPGKLTYGSSGNGSSTHLSAELLKITGKVFVTHIPYRGASAVVTDALGGQIDVGVATLPSVMPMITSGRVRALAVTGKARSPALPDVPTFAEAGVPGYESDNWYGIFAPGGTPPALVKQIHDAVKAAASTPAFRQRAASEGLEVSLETPDATARFVKAEEVKWKRVVKEQSITAD
jgi:tripartite-type tricarboxylate transporter receptor subunit TctC